MVIHGLRIKTCMFKKNSNSKFSSFGCFVFEFWVLRFRDLGASFSSFGCLSRFELHSIRYRILVIALDFCCIYVGLVFIKDRPVSSFLGA